MSTVLWCLAAAVLITTLLPLTNSVNWWIRMWDFPRLHIAGVALLVFVIALPYAIAFKGALMVMMAAACAYQLIQIHPYMPWARTEIAFSTAPAPDVEVSLLAVNVLMENTRHRDLIDIIAREDPDVLLLMETDARWNDALESVLSRYDVTKSHIADDHYGLIFATRLETINVDLLWPKQDDTPAVRATLVAPNGTAFNFIGLHPRPPVPGNDTEARDAQIKDAALMTQSSERPTICMGDFNDVAWSWTTRRFKRYGKFLEPRVGRGMISSFHADYSFMRFPIDQLYVTEDVKLVSFNRLESFGSDHFPMKATVFFDDNGGGDSDR